MSKNCFLTRLKGTVDNNSLPVLGALMIHVSASSARKVITVYTGSTGTTAKAIGGNFVDNSGNVLGDTLTIPANSNYTMYIAAPTECDVVIYNKYVLGGMTMQSPSAKLMDYSFDCVGNDYNGSLFVNLLASPVTNSIVQRFDIGTFSGKSFEKLNAKGVTGSFENITITNDINLYNSDIDGAFTFGSNITNAQFINCTDKTKINTTALSGCTKISTYNGSNITAGDIANLAGCKKLMNIDLTGCSGVNGDIEDLIEGFVSGDHDTGDVTIQLLDTAVKFHDALVPVSTSTGKTTVIVTIGNGAATVYLEAISSGEKATYDNIHGWHYL